MNDGLRVVLAGCLDFIVDNYRCGEESERRALVKFFWAVDDVAATYNIDLEDKRHKVYETIIGRGGVVL